MDGDDRVDKSLEDAEHKVGAVWEEIDRADSDIDKPAVETGHTDILDQKELQEAKDSAIAELVEDEMQNGESKKMSRAEIIKRNLDILKGKVGGSC